MDEDAQTTWFAAAFMALEGFRPDEIAAGAKHAMRRADHPSKVVPLIVSEAERVKAMRPRSERPIALPRPVETAEQRAERQEVGAMMRNLVRRLEANAA